MSADQLFKAGQLSSAIEAQIQLVKANPTDDTKRLFLFEMLVFAGQWERARKQLDVLNYPEMERQAALASYRQLLEAEQARRDLFEKGVQPKFLAEPPEHIRQRLEAVNQIRAGKLAEASATLTAANESCGSLTGRFNNIAFTECRDGDDLFAFVLEVMSKGQYFWVPLEHIEGVALSAPKFPRDLIWMPARLEMQEASGEVFLPALYPGSAAHADPQIQLGRATDWIGGEGEPIRGVGARTYLIGDEAYTVPQWRSFEIGDISGEAPAA